MYVVYYLDKNTGNWYEHQAFDSWTEANTECNEIKKHGYEAELVQEN